MTTSHGSSPYGSHEAIGSRFRTCFLSWYDSPAVAKIKIACMIASEFLPRIISGNVEWCRHFFEDPYAHAATAGLTIFYVPSGGIAEYSIDGASVVRHDRKFEFEFQLAIHDLVTAAYCVESRLITTAAMIRVIDHISCAYAYYDAETPSPEIELAHLDGLIDRSVALLTPTPNPSTEAFGQFEVWFRASYEIPLVHEIFDPPVASVEGL